MTRSIDMLLAKEGKIIVIMAERTRPRALAMVVLAMHEDSNDMVELDMESL